MADFDFSQLTPEQIQQLLQLGTMDEQDQAIMEQLRAAQALQQSQSGGHRTALAAGIGGLGDAFRAFGGTMKERQARAQRSELLDKKRAGRELFAKLLFGPQGAPEGARSVAPAAPLSYEEPEEPADPYGYVPGMYKKPGPWR